MSRSWLPAEAKCVKARKNGIVSKHKRKGKWKTPVLGRGGLATVLVNPTRFGLGGRQSGWRHCWSGCSGCENLLPVRSGKGSLGKLPLAARNGRAMQRAEAGKPLIKFNHCRKCIYSFSVPSCCPLCRQDLGSRKLEEAPVSISNPFTNGHQEKCAFLLRPTEGTFLRYSVCFF